MWLQKGSDKEQTERGRDKSDERKSGSILKVDQNICSDRQTTEIQMIIFF